MWSHSKVGINYNTNTRQHAQMEMVLLYSSLERNINTDNYIDTASNGYISEFKTVMLRTTNQHIHRSSHESVDGNKTALHH